MMATIAELIDQELLKKLEKLKAELRKIENKLGEKEVCQEREKVGGERWKRRPVGIVKIQKGQL